MFVSLIAGVAIGGLISSNSAPSAAPSAPDGIPDATASGPAIIPPATEMERRLPLWGFMALALTCAAGSMFVTEQLKNAEAKRLRRKPPARQPMLAPDNMAALPAATANPDLALAIVPPHLMLTAPPRVSHASQQNGVSQSIGLSQLPDPTSLTTSQLDSLMAITGALAVTTSQLSQPRLAELLDLRKQRSLDDLMVVPTPHQGLVQSARSAQKTKTK